MISNSINKPLLFARYIYTALFIILYPLILYFRVGRAEHITSLLIPLLVFAVFINVLLTNIKKEKKDLLQILSFFLIMTGDWIINLTPCKIYSIIPFSLAHIFFSVFFFLDCGKSLRDMKSLFSVTALASIFFFLNYSKIPELLKLAAFTAYLLILSLMLWRALCYIGHAGFSAYKILLIVFGAILFFITDCLVCLMLIYNTDKYIFWIWLIYPPSLFALSISSWFNSIESTTSMGDHQ